MKYLKTGRVTLAILFIALGFVIFFRNIIGYSLIKFCPIIWPFILIVFGIEIIVNNYKSIKDESSKLKIDLPSIMMISVILGIMAITPLTMDLKKVGRNYFEHDYKHKEVIFQDKVLKKNKKLIIDDNYSDIIINESKDENINLTVETTYRYNDKKVNKLNEKKLIQIIEERDFVKITTKNPQDFNNSNLYKQMPKRNKYTLWIPSNMMVEIINSYGNVKLKDIKNNVNIVSNYASISLEDIKGSIILNTFCGKLNIEDIDGDLNIQSKYCKTNIKNVIGELYISSKGGNINYKTDEIIDKNIEIYCDYGNINMELDEDQEGKFNIITNYGNIYDELNFEVIESASNSSINETIGKLDPKINIRVSKGNMSIKSN